MSERTKIEWTDYTFNPWSGCAKVSPGCANCYAESWAKLSGIVEWGPGKPRRRTTAANWGLPVKWDRKAGEVIDFGHPVGDPPRPRVFCASVADWLDPEVPAEWLADLLDLIFATPFLDWQLLTKRPGLWEDRIEAAIRFLETETGWTDLHPLDPDVILHGKLCDWVSLGSYPANVWVGTSVEDQKRAEERIPELLEIPARVRFLTCEPLLERLDLSPIMGRHCTLGNYNAGIHWIIAGGESGRNCRPFDSAWARVLRDAARDGCAAFFMTQMGGRRKPFEPIPDDLMIREFPTPNHA